MSSFSGKFIWYELLTTDPEAAKAFYGSVIGWQTQPGPVPDMDYTIFTANGTGVAGLMAQPEPMQQSGAPPSWGGVVGVDDVDAAAAKVESLGGRLFMPPMDIPTVGRYAPAMDPQGAAIGLFKPFGGEGGDQDQPCLAGRVGWHELHAADWQQAFGFYETMFGWQKAEAMDMGPMGTYQTFSAGGQQIGGMFTKPAAEPVPYWLYYLTVDDIDQALARATKGGASVLNGPMQVPTGDWIVQARDPQGAMFALVGKRVTAG